jgi:hypothetical protein
MADASWPSIITALISAVVGGVSVAFINYFLNRKKTTAEVNKLVAETEKIRTEMNSLTQAVNNLADTNEKIVFDGRSAIDGFSIKGQGGQFWTGMGSEAKPISPRGEGTLSFEGNVLNIQRANKEGRFEVSLKQYSYNERVYSSIPVNEFISGKRKLRVSCEAKSIGGEHTLRFVVRDIYSGRRLADDAKVINKSEWTLVQAFLQADPTEESELRIDDEQVSTAPSSIQIRNLMVAEKQS